MNQNDCSHDNRQGDAFIPRVSPETRREGLNTAGKFSAEGLQAEAMKVCSTFATRSHTWVPRGVNLPVVAFDALQDLKRRHGFHKNVEAICYALALADTLEAFLGGDRGASHG